MQFKIKLCILTVLLMSTYIITHTCITVKHIKEIERLNNKLDSITISNINNNNHTYSYITAFEYKTPEDGIDGALQYYNIEHPTIVKAQAILETARFTSDLCIKNNNLFGLYDSKNKRYYSYNHWWESIEAYKKLIQRKYNNSKYYYMFLEDIKYAEDKEYINKLKEIAEELE